MAPGDARRKARIVPWYFYGMASLAVALGAYLGIHEIELALWAVLVFGITSLNLSFARLCWTCGRVSFAGIRRPSVYCAGCGATLQKLYGKKKTT